MIQSRIRLDNTHIDQDVKMTIIIRKSYILILRELMNFDQILKFPLWNGAEVDSIVAAALTAGSLEWPRARSHGTI